MLASHDSITGYKLKSWWFKPLEFIGKCQDKTIREQFKLGVRYFDIRLNYYKGTWYGSHGLLLYDIDIDRIFRELHIISTIYKTEIYFRILMEDTLDEDTTLPIFKETILKKFSNYKSNTYLKLHCIGQKSNWNNHEYFIDIPFYGKNDFNPTPSGIKYKITEIQNNIGRNNLSVYECYTYKGFKYLFGLTFPRYVANKINKVALDFGKYHNDLVMIDFV